VRNNPINFNDPTGHWECNLEPDECAFLQEHNSGNGITITMPSNNGGGDIDDGEEPQCDTRGCLETPTSDFDIIEAYEQGWDNFGQAWDIWTNPNASYAQRFGAGAYMGAWGGAHVCLILCTGVVAVEFLALGAITCMVALKCAEAVFWSGGQLARNAAEAFARTTNRVTLEMTLPGRALDIAGKFVPYQYMKPFFDVASRQLARGTSGAVDVFINPYKFNPVGTWQTVELVALRTNSAVTDIFRTIVP
jgi:hypothetical protein